MKLFYTATVHGIDQDLDQVCPFHNKIEGRERPYYLGSTKCKECPYCYGYGLHPNPWHKPFILPVYSVWDNENKTDSEYADDGLTNYKFVSECDYIKCMLGFSKQGQRMFKNRFKLWMWKHVGEKLTIAKYKIIDGYVNLKIKLKGY